MNTIALKKYSKIYTALSVVILAFWFAYQVKNSPTCQEYMQQHLSEQYSGIVVEKFVDSMNHNNKTILIRTQRGQFNKQIYNKDKSGLFEYVELADSITKKHSTYRVDVYRNSRNQTFHIDYQCDQ